MNNRYEIGHNNFHIVYDKFLEKFLDEDDMKKLLLDIFNDYENRKEKDNETSTDC